MFATISADIVSSTSLSVNETIGLKQRIESLFSLLKVSYPDFEASPNKRGLYRVCNAECIKRIPDSLYNQILHQIFFHS